MVDGESLTIAGLSIGCHDGYVPSAVVTARSLAVTLASALVLVGCAAGSTTTAGTSPTTGIPTLGAVGTATSRPTRTSTPVTTGSTIDGFKVGVQVACSPGIGPPPSGGWCQGLDPAKAIAALDARDPGHAPIVSVVTFTDGTQPEPVDVTGNAPTPTPAPTAHSGPLVTVFVFELADGSIRATGVACPATLKNGAIVALQGSCFGVGSYP